MHRSARKSLRGHISTCILSEWTKGTRVSVRHFRKFRVFQTITFSQISGISNLRFACGSHFTKTMAIMKTTAMAKTTQKATNKDASAGLVEITETTEMTKTTGIRGANHRFPKQWVRNYFKYSARKFWTQHHITLNTAA